MEVVGKTLFRPVSLPPLTVSKEYVDGPTICMSSTLTSQKRQQIL